MSEKPDWQDEKPLRRLSCASYACDKDLHSFLTWRPKKGENYRHGHCRACDADLITWQRIDKKDLDDVDYTFTSLKKEFFRHRYWHKPFDELAVIRARKKGLNNLKVWIENRVRTTLSKPKSENDWDGQQTPLEGNIVYYAQHATATCCRRCAECWWGIGRNDQLQEKDVKYFTQLILKYIEARFPNIPLEGEKIHNKTKLKSSKNE